MAFPKITEALTANKGVTGLPDTPALSAGDMQKKFDELSIDVIIPFVNEHIDELNSNEGASNIGAKPTPNMGVVGDSLQDVLDALDNMTRTSIDGAKFTIDAETGHLIITYADGSTGDMGAVALVPKGEFKADVSYGKFSMVSYNNVLYASIEDVPLGTLPTDETYWIKMFDISATLDAKADKTTVEALEDKVDEFTDIISGTLIAGETTIELLSDKITATSIIDPYIEEALGVESEPISYLTKKVEVGKVTFTFDARETNLTVGIIVK